MHTQVFHEEFRDHFCVGDRVRVRKDIVKGKRYPMLIDGDEYYDDVVTEMAEMAGLVLTIKNVYVHGYHVYENNWHWTDLMFEQRTVDDGCSEPIDFAEVAALL